MKRAAKKAPEKVAVPAGERSPPEDDDRDDLELVALPGHAWIHAAEVGGRHHGRDPDEEAHEREDGGLHEIDVDAREHRGVLARADRDDVPSEGGFTQHIHRDPETESHDEYGRRNPQDAPAPDGEPELVLDVDRGVGRVDVGERAVHELHPERGDEGGDAQLRDEHSVHEATEGRDGDGEQYGARSTDARDHRRPQDAGQRRHRADGDVEIPAHDAEHHADRSDADQGREGEVAGEVVCAAEGNGEEAED